MTSALNILSETNLVSFPVSRGKICPLFNDSPPDTDRLNILKELIIDKKESLKAISVFKDPSDYPEKLKNLNEEQLEKDIKLLEIEKNDIENKIAILLKKNA